MENDYIVSDKASKFLSLPYNCIQDDIETMPRSVSHDQEYI